MASDDYYDWRKNLPPIATIFPQLGQPSMAPFGETGMTYPTPEPTPMRPYTMPKVNPPLGPGAAENITAPSTTGTAMTPSLLGFGASSSVPDKEKTFQERFLAALQDKNYQAALAQIAKGAGGGLGKIPQAQAFHMQGPSRMGGPSQDLKGAGGALMAKALSDMAGDHYDITQPIQKKRKGEQARYDVLGRRQSQDLSELFKNLV